MCKKGILKKWFLKKGQFETLVYWSHYSTQSCEIWSATVCFSNDLTVFKTLCFFILLVPLAFHICMLHLLAFPFSVYHATHHVRACTRLKYFIAEPVFFKLKLYERVTFVINNILNKLFMKLKLSANYFTRKNCF